MGAESFGLFRQRLDFEKFKASYTYEVVPGDSLRPRNLAAYEFQIDSNGRGMICSSSTG